MMIRLLLFIIIGSFILEISFQVNGPKSNQAVKDEVERFLKKVTGDQTIPIEPEPDPVSICTFNIQFLGSSRKRDDMALTTILKDYDIIVIQEMVAPPVNGQYPDGSKFIADPESKHFFELMLSNGFQFLMSEEDTGTGDRIHTAGTSTEWFISFYKARAVSFAPDLPHGFLAADRSNHPDFERVPYAFPFRMIRGKNDFVLISVHLNPGEGNKARARRKHEILSINQWISKNNQKEKDFFILGDMNIENRDELENILPAGIISLNDECRRTNTLINTRPPDFGAKPFDHVLYFRENSKNEVDLNFDCHVIDLVTIMKPFWKEHAIYPGNPYNHNVFRQYYSDHDPLVFRMKVLLTDDD